MKGNIRLEKEPEKVSMRLSSVKTKIRCSMANTRSNVQRVI